MNRTPTANERDDEDAAAVLAVLVAIIGATDPTSNAPAAQSIWGDPAHRIGIAPAPSATAWWASGMPR
jgi:hypothetical protein